MDRQDLDQIIIIKSEPCPVSGLCKETLEKKLFAQTALPQHRGGYPENLLPDPGERNNGPEGNIGMSQG